MTYQEAVIKTERILDDWVAKKGSNEALIHAVAYSIWEAANPELDNKTAAIILTCDDRSL